MRIRFPFFLLSMAILSLFGNSLFAVTVQTEENVLDDGSAYLWVEAESVFELGGEPAADADDVGFIIVDSTNPIQGISEIDGVEVPNGGLDILTADTNASNGAAVFHQLGGGGNAKWQLQFAIPADYYLYMHYSFYNRDANTNYSNEDSIYLPPSFNANSRDAWIGYEGIQGDPLDPDPKTGDSNRDGWMPLGKDIISGGELETHNSTDEEFWDGQFHWAYMDVAVDMDENDAFVSDFGHTIVYEVSEDDTGTVLDFEISGREPYGVIDGLLFSTSNTLLEDFTQDQMREFFLNKTPVGPVGDYDSSGALDLPDVNQLSVEVAAGTNNGTFDLTGDGNVDTADLNNWVKEQFGTWLGDSNLDGEFNSGDLVAIFGAGKYQNGQAANWSEGDWNGDGVFDSGDLVTAFSDGGYELGPPPANQVPEPTGIVLTLIGLFALSLNRRR